MDTEFLPNITMGIHKLDVCTQYEYLGIILDDEINLKKTIGKTVGTASNRCHMLYKMRRKMTKHTATLVYKQTILPVLEYCGFLYNGLTYLQHKRLQIVQNRCLRACLNVKIKYPVVKLHADTNIHYLNVRYDLQLMLLFHKYLYESEHDAEDFGIYLYKPPTGGRTTRSTNTLVLKHPPSRRLGYRRSPLYRGIELWNELDVSCRLEANKEAFRRKAREKISSLHVDRNK